MPSLSWGHFFCWSGRDLPHKHDLNDDEYFVCGINFSSRLIFPLRCKIKKALTFVKAFSSLAVRTGFEPATPCVTGMYSNQLNYRTVF